MILHFILEDNALKPVTNLEEILVVISKSEINSCMNFIATFTRRQKVKDMIFFSHYMSELVFTL